MPCSSDLSTYSPLYLELSEAAYTVGKHNPIVWPVDSIQEARKFRTQWYGWRTALRLAFANGSFHLEPLVAHSNCVEIIISSKKNQVIACNKYYNTSYIALQAALRNTPRHESETHPSVLPQFNEVMDNIAPLVNVNLDVIASELNKDVEKLPRIDKADELIKNYYSTRPLSIEQTVPRADSPNVVNLEPSDYDGAPAEPIKITRRAIPRPPGADIEPDFAPVVVERGTQLASVELDKDKRANLSPSNSPPIPNPETKE